MEIRQKISPNLRRRASHLAKRRQRKRQMMIRLRNRASQSRNLALETLKSVR